MSVRGPIVILAGRSHYAAAMIRIYTEAFGRSNLRIVEESPSAVPKLFKFLRTRIRHRGILSAFDALALRAVLEFHHADQSNIEPDLQVGHVNDDVVAEYVIRERPSIVILCVCSLLSAKQISRIGVPIINVHNGITPRYRGSGNLWALAEDNPAMVGVTLHRVDAGVDTGERISVERFDPAERGISLAEMDVEAFRRGAELAVAYVQSGAAQIPPDCRHLVDRYYAFPGLSTWLRARKNLRRRMERKTSAPVEAVWRQSFHDLAGEKTLDVPGRLHWHDGRSIVWRDAAALAEAQAALGPAGRVLDVGCGDGRLSRAFGDSYVGCDFSEATLALAPPGKSLTVAAAHALPFMDSTFEVTLAIGLLQHVDDSQAVADELLRVTRPGGTVVINTLRQFSPAELLAIGAASLLHPKRLALVAAIWRRKHGVRCGGALVARRYKRREIKRLFPKASRVVSTRYHGAFGLAMFAREITMSVRLPLQIRR